jgi:hypothetical protein
MRISIECMTLGEIRDLEAEGFQGNIEKNKSIHLFV